MDWLPGLSDTLPENAAGEPGLWIDNLMDFITYILTPWVFLTFGAVLLFLLIYNKSVNEEGIYVDSHETLFTFLGFDIPRTGVMEAAVLLVLALDLWIFFASMGVWNPLRVNTPDEMYTEVGVQGRQFAFDFFYPEEPGGEVEMGQLFYRRLVIPQGENIELAVTSDDVIHSVFIPELRYKQSAVPSNIVEGTWIHAEKVTRPVYYERDIQGKVGQATSVVEESAPQHVNRLEELTGRLRDLFSVDGDRFPDYETARTEVGRTLRQIRNSDQTPEDAVTHLEDVLDMFDRIDEIFSEYDVVPRGYLHILCAELCGQAHSGMTAELRVMPMQEYEEWHQNEFSN